LVKQLFLILHLHRDHFEPLHYLSIRGERERVGLRLTHVEGRRVSNHAHAFVTDWAELGEAFGHFVGIRIGLEWLQLLAVLGESLVFFT